MSFFLRRFVPASAAVVIAVGSVLAALPGKTAQAAGCPTTSALKYKQGGMLQWDKEANNVVRPNTNHPDKTLYMRGSGAVNGTLGLVNYGPSQDKKAPQFATIFKPTRMPTFTQLYGIHTWNWADPPNPGSAGGGWESFPIPSGYSGTTASMLGVQTTAGEVLRTPTSGYNLGAPWGKGSVVINADSAHHSITLHFTREDTITRGYAVMIEGVCIDPNLQALYNTLDNADRNPAPANHYGAGNKPGDKKIDYNLPGLTAGQVFGTAMGSEIRLVIRDNGSWMDPRDKNDWWRVIK